MRHRKGRPAAVTLLVLATVTLSFAAITPSGASATATTTSPYSFAPGVPWADTNGDLIQGHNGSILKPYGSSTYYWVGQELANTGKRQDAACYQSTDLVHWTPVPGFSLSTAGLPLPSPPAQPPGAWWLIGTTKIIEASQTASSSQFVIWAKMKVKNGTFPPVGDGFIDVATSSSPCGTYTWQGQDGQDPAPWQPFNHPVGDIGLFQDTTGGPGTGTGYLLTTDNGGNSCVSTEPNCIKCVSTYANCINPGSTPPNPVVKCDTGETDCVFEWGVRIFQLQAGDTQIQGTGSVWDLHQSDGTGIEAPTMFKNASTGTYYVLMSGATSWEPNPNLYSSSSSPAGPWNALQPVYVPDSSAAGPTCDSQTMWVQPVQGTASTTYIYMGDRWDSSNVSDGPGHDSLGDSSYVWLPLQFTDGTSLTTSGTVPTLDCTVRNWSLSAATGKWVNLGPNFPDAMFTFTNVGSGEVMEADGAGQANPAFQAASNGQKQQQWQILEVTYTPSDRNFTPRYEIRNVSSGQALRDDSGTLDQANYTGASSQLWQFVSVSNGPGLTLKNISTGHIAEVSADGTTLDTATAATPTPATGQQWALSEVPSYWAFTSHGNVYNQDGAPWFGSLGSASPPVTDVTGLAVTPDGEGYWLIESDGTVSSFGDAMPVTTAIATSCPGGINGVTADPAGGFYAFTACGNVYNEAGATWQGSLANANPPVSDVTGLAATSDGKQYWLVESGGTVTQFNGSTPVTSSITTSCPGGIKGAATDLAGGYYAFTGCGDVHAEAGALSHGSQACASQGVTTAALAATPDGGGYWLDCSDGSVLHHGNATSGTSTIVGAIGAAGNPDM